MGCLTVRLKTDKYRQFCENGVRDFRDDDVHSYVVSDAAYGDMASDCFVNVVDLHGRQFCCGSD